VKISREIHRGVSGIGLLLGLYHSYGKVFQGSINMREPEFKRIKPSCIQGSYTHLTNRINRIDKSLFERLSPRFSESSGARRRYGYFPSILVI